MATRTSRGPGRGPGVCLILLVTLAAAACGSSRAHMASAPMAPGQAAPIAAPPPLERSLFARDPGGQLTEDALQAILAAPIELDLPARVGVAAVVTAADWRGPSPDYQRVPAGVAPFVKRLRGSEPFTLVTEIMPIPSGALGMEALREQAARYRLRYAILYREVLAQRRSHNGWAWLYATGVGALVAPGQQHRAYGYIEASLFDVKTGILLFTTRRAVDGARRSNRWNQGEKLEQLQAGLVGRFAPELADDLKADLYRYVAAVEVEDQRRAQVAAGGAPVRLEVPASKAVATEP